MLQLPREIGLLTVAALAVLAASARGQQRPGPGDAGDECVKCHAGQAAGTSQGMHPVIGSGEPRANAATCTSCHSTHAAGSEAPKADTNVSNKLCLTCHELAQPERFAPPRKTPHNALDCTMCHSVHEAAEPRRLLNTSLDDAEFCMQCHDDYEVVLETPHNLAKFAPAVENSRGRTAETGGPCSACHNIHSEARPVVKAPAETARCTGCHSTGGPAPAPIYRPHPAIPMLSPLGDDDDGYLPLIGADGAPGPAGTIGCMTCHMPHGRYPTGPAADPATLRAQRLLVRPYVAPNLCSACHGFDGLSRFLRFHDPNRAGVRGVP